MIQQKLFSEHSENHHNILYSQSDNSSLPNRYQQQLEHVLEVAIIVLDLDFRIQQWNHQAEKLYGWKAEEVIGLPLVEILPTDYRNRNAPLSLEGLLAVGKWEGEVVHKTKHGKKQHIHASFHLVDEDKALPKEILMVNRNISEKIEMRDSVLAANQHLKVHIDNSPLAYIQWDEQFKVQQWSDQATNVFGWTEEEVRGKTLDQLQLVHQADRKKVDNLMIEILSGTKENCVCESRYYTKSGEVIYCEWYNSVMRDKQGKITSMLSLINDVTDKVTSKQKLKEVHLQLEHTLSSIRTVVWSLELIEHRLNVKYISPNINKITGISATVLSRNIYQWQALIHPTDLLSYKRYLTSLLRGKTDYAELEYRIIDRQGRIKWVLDQINVERNNGVVTLSGSLKDITVKRELWKLAEESERKIRHITKTIPGVIFQMIRSKDGREWFKYLNKESEMLEIKDGLLQSNISVFWEKIIPEDRLAVKEALHHSEIHLARFDSSFRVMNGDKVEWYRAVSEPEWLEEEKRTIWTGIIMDTTEQRQLLEELERRNFELTNFAYRVSHDLRAPLSSVKGIVGLAQMEENSPTVTSYLSMIESSIHRLDQFICNVLHHTKVANDQIRAEKIDFQKITAEILNDLSYMPAYDRIEKQIEVSEEVVQYCSDPMLIMVILRNLISNGIKYHDPSKSQSYFRISITKVNHGIQVIYKDNGVGIAQEKLSKVFDMFYRASESSNGSGIGLYILKQAVEKLQGHIQVQSALQEGTSFEIILPKLEETAEH
ncbi:MAG: PAS domain S-box protein [Cyclobacteriaceae bacterium]